MDAFVIGQLLGYLIGLVIVAAVLYVVIRTAVLHALTSHYKTIRLYEKTGEWSPKYHGTGEPRRIE
ncbi:hypothetical protein VH571_10330 [Frondihabitans sp. 4ASC-45]|uniref:hypothetical protein n=1 Tax=Frondihabitans sp. 4ASC-45 TaxID=3111636 RepID=UPI003C1DDF4B